MIEIEAIVVGAGPIGIEVASGLRRAHVNYVHLEAEQIGATIHRWPRDTRFFSSPERVAIAGIPVQTVDQDMLTGEHYLAYLRSVVEILDLPIRTFERVTAIERTKDGFRVATDTRAGTELYSCKYVILATGDMNGPRMLGIPGEDLEHVTHYFDEPHRYFRQRLLVVGGRNSAIEAAIRCWRAGADVTISYRGSAFDRDHVNSRLHLEAGIITGKGYMGFLPNTRPVEITKHTVILEDVQTGSRSEQPADFVLLCTGFEADVSLLEQAGAELAPPESIPVVNEHTMETTVPGLFVAGTLCSGKRASYRHFIGTSHHHTEKIVARIAGEQTVVAGSIPSRAYAFTRADIHPDENQSPDENY